MQEKNRNWSLFFTGLSILNNLSKKDARSQSVLTGWFLCIF